MKNKSDNSKNQDINKELLAKFEAFLASDGQVTHKGFTKPQLKPKTDQIENQLAKIQIAEILEVHAIAVQQVQYDFLELQEQEQELQHLEMIIEAQKQAKKGFETYVDKASKKLNF